MFTCIYCNKKKDDKEATLEHIFPKSLGGALLNNDIYKTHDVCEVCNRNMGLWVDGVFIKSWLVNNLKAMSYNKFIDLDKGTPVPLSYMGQIDELSVDGFTCDYWLGIAGESVFHIHECADDKFNTYVGGNVILKKTKPGTVYYIANEINEAWYRTCLISVVTHFKEQRRIFVNGRIDNDEKEEFFNIPNEIETKTANKLLEYKKKIDESDDKIRCTVRMLEGFEHRILAKLAIGLGYNIIGKEYLKSKNYKQMLKMLWSKTMKDRKDLQIHGSDFSHVIGKNAPFDLLFGEDRVSILIFHDGDELALVLDFWRKLTFSIKIIDSTLDDNLLSSPISNSTLTYLFEPIGKSIGPITLTDAILHYTKKQIIPELDVIDKSTPNPNPLPPRNKSQSID